mmetsp:Transcript_130299/g.324944  ORF Transcript_130299/g.324944 Transcript_130299/m.324944 type:complete len:223 (-) Transcript_130299:35-703(-)
MSVAVGRDQRRVDDVIWLRTTLLHLTHDVLHRLNAPQSAHELDERIICRQRLQRHLSEDLPRGPGLHRLDARVEDGGAEDGVGVCLHGEQVNRVFPLAIACQPPHLSDLRPLVGQLAQVYANALPPCSISLVPVKEVPTVVPRISDELLLGLEGDAQRSREASSLLRRRGRAGRGRRGCHIDLIGGQSSMAPASSPSQDSEAIAPPATEPPQHDDAAHPRHH